MIVCTLMNPIILLKKIGLLSGIYALDVGARNCVYATELAEAGFSVDAIDVIDCPSQCLASNIHYTKVRFEDFSVLKKYDVIIARHVIPFLSISIEKSLHKLIDMLSGNGVLYISVFGEKDDWSVKDNVMITNLNNLHKIVGNYVHVLYQSEEEFKGKTYSGEIKKWHIITMVLVKK